MKDRLFVVVLMHNVDSGAFGLRRISFIIPDYDESEPPPEHLMEKAEEKYGGTTINVFEVAFEKYDEPD